MFERLTSLLVFAALLAAIHGCASSTHPPYVDCPAKVSGYVAGKATASYVKSCLGLPIREERHPDGRSAAVYYIDNQTRVVFLFDKAGALVKTTREK